eukprot:10308140-Karenia_brevis.AAC.1
MVRILYKLFPRLVLRWLNKHLESEQAVDQAGFRSGYSTDDLLFTFTLLQEKIVEWQQDLWVAAVDFKKAFDT